MSDRSDRRDDGVEIRVGLWPVVGGLVVIVVLGFAWLLGAGMFPGLSGEHDGAGTAASSHGVGAAPAAGGVDAASDGPAAGVTDAGAGSAGDASAGGSSSVAGVDAAPGSVTVPLRAGEEVLLATVGDEPVTTRDVDLEVVVQASIRQQIGMPMDTGPAELERFRRDVLERLLDQRALVQAARGAGIRLLEDEVSAGLFLMGSQLGVDGEVLYGAAIDAGITEGEYRDWVEGQLLIERYLGTDEARNLAREEMARRGLPSGAGVPIDQESLAVAVGRAANVKIIVDGEPVSPAAVGETAPDVSLVGLDGAPVTLSDLRGKPLVLNFWATWCAPCRLEMPILQQAHEAYGDDVTILGVDVDEPADAVAAYIDAIGVDFPIALDDEADAARLFRARALPTTYFIDADGVVLDSHRGALRSTDPIASLAREDVRSEGPDAAP